MMRRRSMEGCLILVTAIALGALPGLSVADEEVAAAQESRPVKDPSLREASGRVAAVSAQEKCVVVRKTLIPVLATRQFAVDWQTGIVTTGGRRLSLSELKAGDPVRIQYAKQQDGKRLARMITVQRS